MSSAFERVEPADIVRFVGENPLAWIVPSRSPADAVLMPLLMEVGADGAPDSLLGHLPRKAPVCEALAGSPRAHFLFLGPHAYIPPGWISKPGWAPTWNFVSLKVAGLLELDESLTDFAVTRLVEHMEGNDAGAWTVDEMGDRFHMLTKGIIGFRARIDTLVPRFKVGQDETVQSANEIRHGLSDHPLARWMDH